MEHLEKIQSRIYEVRGVRVMLDFDLAALYQVETRALKQAVRRNLERFPEDFLFRLTSEESNLLIYNGVSQIVIPPGYNLGGAEMFAFTEQGVAMLSSVLRSPRAIQVNISIMRAFVAMRNDLSEDMREEISNIYQAIAALSVKVHQPTCDRPRQKIGFKIGKDEKK